MGETLISKKDVLQRYGISYGALYRWKRKGLIPESWFIRKSTETGQETFFDEKMICERIEWILRQKNERSLGELAEQLAPAEDLPCLVVVTPSGRYRYRSDELLELLIEDSAGNARSITKSAKKLLDDAGKTKNGIR